MKTNVTLELDGAVARMTLRPDPADKPTTIDMTVLDALEQCLDTVERTASVRVLLLESASAKYFCVGGDLKALQDLNAESIRQWILRGHEVFDRLEGLDVPSIAVVRGIAYGGGLELALACDMIFSLDTARFALPESGLGFIPGWGGTLRLPRRVGVARAKHIIFTGRPISAQQAEAIGLVAYTADDAGLTAEINATVKSMIGNNRTSIAMSKHLVDGSFESPAASRGFEEAIASTACLNDGDTKQRLEHFFQRK